MNHPARSQVTETRPKHRICRARGCRTCPSEPEVEKNPHQAGEDDQVSQSITLDYLSGQVMAQNTLIHVLFGECVIDDPEDWLGLHDALSAALRTTRFGVDASGDEKRGCVKTLEEAIEALEYMRLDPARK